VEGLPRYLEDRGVGRGPVVGVKAVGWREGQEGKLRREVVRFVVEGLGRDVLSELLACMGSW
jgi:hypothetical protein